MRKLGPPTTCNTNMVVLKYIDTYLPSQGNDSDRNRADVNVERCRISLKGPSGMIYCKYIILEETGKINHYVNNLRRQQYARVEIPT